MELNRQTSSIAVLAVVSVISISMLVYGYQTTQTTARATAATISEQQEKIAELTATLEAQSNEMQILKTDLATSRLEAAKLELDSKALTISAPSYIIDPVTGELVLAVGDGSPQAVPGDPLQEPTLELTEADKQELADIVANGGTKPTGGKNRLDEAVKPEGFGSTKDIPGKDFGTPTGNHGNPFDR